MKKAIYIIFTTAILICSLTLSAQVAINTDGASADASAMLDIKSTDKGVLIPRMTQSERNSIASPATGLLIYQSDNTPGFNYYDGSNWVIISGSGSGATDINSLSDGKTGGYSVFLGTSAGNLDDSIDNYNVGIGDFALSNNTSGGANTSVGTWSLAANTTGVNNTAFGFGALNSNISGNYNTSFGIQCLASNTTDSANTAFGYQAGKFVTGSGNVFLGYQAGINETGSNKLYISNSDTAKPLIYGDFETKKVALNGRVGIGTSSPDASASLDVSSTTSGFLPPRMSTSEMNAITSPSAGLMVYNTTVNSVFCYNGSSWKMMFENDGVSCGTLTYSGQTYETVIIGTQCWMAENLNVGNRIDGNDEQTNNSTIEKHCYDDNTAYCDTYGGLYKWNEMMQYVTTEGTQGICPSGWHLPTDAEWKTMEIHLGMSQSQADVEGTRGTDEGGKLKETGTTHWTTPNTGATNTSGFTAISAGFFAVNNFGGLGDRTFFWTSTEISDTNAWLRALQNTHGKVSRSVFNKINNSFSVRCLKD